MLQGHGSVAGSNDIARRWFSCLSALLSSTLALSLAAPNLTSLTFTSSRKDKPFPQQHLHKVLKHNPIGIALDGAHPDDSSHHSHRPAVCGQPRKERGKLEESTGLTTTPDLPCPQAKVVLKCPDDKGQRSFLTILPEYKRCWKSPRDP